jgi:ubiquinone/menaquinone biosynthesis C-methylase UbiE
LARKLEAGLVYGLDIQEAPLKILKSRSLSEKLFNIRPIRTDLEKPNGSTLKESSVDLVLVPNILFQAENKNAIMSEAKRIVRAGGKIVVVDWSVSASFGPKTIAKAEEIKMICQQMGLKLEKEFKAGSYHYCLIFSKG